MPLCVRSSTVRAYGLGLPHSREYYARGRLLLQDQDELLHPPSRFRDMQQISRDKFDCFLRATTEFTLCVLARYGLRDHWPARPTLTPPIRFLYIGSRICSTLPSDPASRRRPCASLSLLLYQDVKRTFTSKLSTCSAYPKKKAALRRPLCLFCRSLGYGLAGAAGLAAGLVAGADDPALIGYC